MTPDSQPTPTPYELTLQAREHLTRAADKTERAFREINHAVHAIELLETALLNESPASDSGAGEEQLSTAHRDVDALSRVADALAGIRATKLMEEGDEVDAAHLFANIRAYAERLSGLVRAGEGYRTRGQLQSEATLLAAHSVRFLADFADRANPTTDDLLRAIGDADRLKNARLAAGGERLNGPTIHWRPGVQFDQVAGTVIAEDGREYSQRFALPRAAAPESIDPEICDRLLELAQLVDGSIAEIVNSPAFDQAIQDAAARKAARGVAPRG